ncbi:UNVERIFIED_CONTAM: hypothetical protein FKN15_017809 [Acipenser sinensis]
MQTFGFFFLQRFNEQVKGIMIGGCREREFPNPGFPGCEEQECNAQADADRYTSEPQSQRLHAQMSGIS